MSAIQGMIILLAVLNYAGFTWSVKYHFKVPRHGMPRSMRITGFVGAFTMCLTLAILVTQREASSLCQWSGLIMYMLSLTIFTWAVRETSGRAFAIAFSDVSPGSFVKAGPYSLVRHPFYTSYLIAWTAGAFATGQLLLMIFTCVMFGFYHKAAVGEEASFLSSSHRVDYLEYKQKTGRFFPKISTLFCTHT